MAIVSFLLLRLVDIFFQFDLLVKDVSHMPVNDWPLHNTIPVLSDDLRVQLLKMLDTL